jgi:hypothetical protein
MSDNTNIPMSDHANGKNAQLSEDKLLAYLEGRLTADEQREVELWLADEGMESDAVDGLREFATEERKPAIGRINSRLKKKLGRKYGKKRTLKTDLNLIAAIIIILLLAAVAWLVVRCIA